MTMLGRKHSPETIEKIRLSKIGSKNPFYGKHLSEEHKQKIGITLASFVVI